ncbi:MAG: DUF1737 domain-containing protein [Alphaproteobacteria bacterium]
MSNSHTIDRDLSGDMDTVIKRVNVALAQHSAKIEGAPTVVVLRKGLLRRQFIRCEQDITATKDGKYSRFVSLSELPHNLAKNPGAYWIVFGEVGSAFEGKIEDAINRGGWQLMGAPSVVSYKGKVHAAQALVTSVNYYDGATFEDLTRPYRTTHSTLYRLVVGIDTSETCAVKEGLINAEWRHVGKDTLAHKGHMLLANSFTKFSNGGSYEGYREVGKGLEPLAVFRQTPSSIGAHGPTG